MKLKEALGIREKAGISLVGGGGKTTLMFALAKELAAAGFHVVTTTTTKIAEPAPSDTPKVILGKDEAILIQEVSSEFKTCRYITVAQEKLASGKLAGVAPDTVVALAALPQISHIIVEADGAAHHSLKAPRDNEPVIPPNTSLVIAVAGLDVLGGKLEEGTVFRSEIAAKLLRVPLGTAISPEIIAALVVLPRGITRGSPAGTRIVPFLNIMDVENGLAKGREVARAILAMSHPQIKTVLLGRAQDPDPVVEIIK